MNRRNLFSRALYVVSAIFIASLLTSCFDTASESPESEQEIAASQKETYDRNYLVAMEATYAPFAFRDDAGYVIGYDRDILEAIGKAQGFGIKIIPQGWDGMFDTLAQGTRDIVGSGVVITDERKKTMDATDPIYLARPNFIVKADGDIKRESDIVGRKIATQGDTTTYKDLVDDYGAFDNEIIGYPTLYLAFKAMLTGDVDAVYGNSGVLNYYVNNLPESYYPGKLHTIYSTYSVASPIGFYVKKGNATLLNELDNGLKAIKNNGDYDRINLKWFGVTN